MAPPGLAHVGGSVHQPVPAAATGRRVLSRGEKVSSESRAPLVAGLAALTVVYLALLLTAPDRFGLLLSFGGVALVAVVLGLRSPVLATMYLLAATFVRLAIPPETFFVDPFLPAFAGVVLSTFIWTSTREAVNRRDSARSRPSWRYTSSGTSCPCGAASLSRWAAAEPDAVPDVAVRAHRHDHTPDDVCDRPYRLRQGSVRPALLWALVAAGAYSAFVSITQFLGPAWLVWPRYIVDAPNWEDRALGVFNQPVVNGLVLIVGFLVANLIAHASESRALRLLATTVAVASTYAIYLTHTRAVWLSFALVLIIGAVSAVGFRTGFVLTLAAMFTAVALNWSNFTSADRDAGGVASPSELQDRLNTMATAWWAIKREPLTGWGNGRFPAVNTYHHQAWSPEVPWERGFGYASHFDMLGITAELGIIGLALWVTVLALVGAELLRAVRRLPAQGLSNRPFALTAAMSFVAVFTTGLTVDLRFFDFPNIVVWLLVGAAIGRARTLHTSRQLLTTAPPAHGRTRLPGRCDSEPQTCSLGVHES